MSKPKKNGVHLDSYISTDIFNRLDRYCEDTSVPKRLVISIAITQFLDGIKEEEE